VCVTKQVLFQFCGDGVLNAIRIVVGQMKRCLILTP
jgi:hypothetical protein